MAGPTADELLDQATPDLMQRMIKLAQVSNDFDAIKYLLDKRIAKTKPEATRPKMAPTPSNITPEAKCKMYLRAMESGVLSLENGETMINCAIKLLVFDDQRAREEILNNLAKLTGTPRAIKQDSFL